jgi:hypothetical protein
MHPPYTYTTNFRRRTLARVLTGLHIRTREAHYAEEAIELLRDAVMAGSRTAPESALGNARFWGLWAERHSSPAAAAEAFELGIEASYQLFRAQVVRSYRWNRLRACGDVHVRAARNQVARSEPKLYAAVVALERGRALVLSETLAVRRNEVDRLEREGHTGLANRYHQAVAQLAERSRQMPEE